MNQITDGDSRDNATRIQHQKSVAACSGASAYTSVYLGIGQSQPQRGSNPHCAGQIVGEAHMILQLPKGGLFRIECHCEMSAIGGGLNRSHKADMGLCAAHVCF